MSDPAQHRSIAASADAARLPVRQRRCQPSRRPADLPCLQADRRSGLSSSTTDSRPCAGTHAGENQLHVHHTQVTPSQSPHHRSSNSRSSSRSSSSSSSSSIHHHHQAGRQASSTTIHHHSPPQRLGHPRPLDHVTSRCPLSSLLLFCSSALLLSRSLSLSPSLSPSLSLSLPLSPSPPHARLSSCLPPSVLLALPCLALQSASVHTQPACRGRASNEWRSDA